jgi:hypothetical protein
MDLGDVECVTGTTDDVNAYIKDRIPNTRDTAIASLLARTKGKSELQELVDAVEPGSGSYMLNFYARRMAALAVRRSDPGYARSGLLALSLSNQKTLDSRDDICTQALLWRSFELLGLDPKTEFEAVLDQFPNASKFIDSWLQRSPKNKKLAAVGFIESRDDDGFRYRFGNDYTVDDEDDDDRKTLRGILSSIYSKFRG